MISNDGIADTTCIKTVKKLLTIKRYSNKFAFVLFSKPTIHGNR